MLAGHGLDLALLMLRVAAGGFLLPHALGKLFGWFGGPGLHGFAAELRGFGLPAVAPLPLLLSLLQVLSGLAVLLGWHTRIAAHPEPALGQGQQDGEADEGSGGSEYPLMWTTVLLALALAGPGAWALDGPRLPGAFA